MKSYYFRLSTDAKTTICFYQLYTSANIKPRLKVSSIETAFVILHITHLEISGSFVEIFVLDTYIERLWNQLGGTSGICEYL